MNKDQKVILFLVILLIIGGVYVANQELKEYKIDFVNDIIFNLAYYQTTTGNIIYVDPNNQTDEIPIKKICSGS